MGRIQADNIIFNFGLYLMIAIPFGIAVASQDIQGMLNTIFGPWATFQQTVNALSGPAKTCGPLDFGCQASAGIAAATAYIGAAIIWPGYLVLSALYRLSVFGNLATLITLGPNSSISAVPVVGPLIMLALIIVVAFELFRMFRGSSSGA